MPREATKRREDNLPFAPGEREAALERRRAAAAVYRNPDMVSGYDLEMKPLSATISGDEIHFTVVLTGEVVRPDALATCKGHTLVIKVPATIERNGSD